METIKFIGLLCFTFLFTEGAAPVQFIKKLLEIHNVSEPKPLYKKVIQGLVNCNMCSGFWIGLIYYWAMGYDSYFLLACEVSLASELFAGWYAWANSKRPL